MNEEFKKKIYPFGWGDFYDDKEMVSLLLSAGYKDEIFEASGTGIEAGGYGWEGLAQVFLKEKMPELVEDIKFDSEGSMFCAYSKNAEVLKNFAIEFRAMCDDEEMMLDLLSRAEDLS